MKVLDTNVIIEYLKGVPEVVHTLDELRVAGEEFSISVITEIELLAHPQRTDDDLDQISQWLQSIQIVPLDSVLARPIADMKRQYRLGIADCIIAATAELLGADLITKDAGLKRLKNIRVISP